MCVTDLQVLLAMLRAKAEAARPSAPGSAEPAPATPR